MTPLRERNPVPIALVGIAVIVAMIVLALNAAALPIIGGGQIYKAAFTEAGGLRTGDEVRIAGVRVGSVDDIKLVGSHVEVDFRVDDGVHFGTLTNAAIKIKTLVGAKDLTLMPAGPGQLSPDDVIPTSRTTPPFEIQQALGGLSQHIDAIDTDALATAFNTISSDLANSPPQVQQALRGLSRLSTTIASRDQALHQLLGRASEVTGVLAARDADLVKIVDDGDLVLREVEQRRAVIHALLVDTAALADQLTGLVRENKATLTPALEQLRSVVDVLHKNQDNLDRTVQLLGPFVREFANATGNGGWFDSIIANLPPAHPTVTIPGAPSTSGGSK